MIDAAMTREQIARHAHAARPRDGRVWEVPCVRAANVGANTAQGRWKEHVAWWPILGRLHQDTEIIGFPYWHFHIDWRFVSEALRTRTVGAGRVAQQVIVNRMMIRPVGDLEPSQAVREGPPGTLPAEAVELWFRTEVRAATCAQPPQWPHDTVWRKALEARYAHAKLAGAHGWTCPHQGADLSGLAHPEEDTVTCPLHGLTWCVHSGKLVAG